MQGDDRLWTLAWLALAATAGSGCGSEPASEPPAEEKFCIETRTSVELSDQTPLGLSAGALLDLAQGQHVDQLVWSESPATTVTLIVDGAGAIARFVRSERNPDVVVLPELGCDDAIELVVAAALKTADGKLDENWPEITLEFRPREELAPDGGWKEGWLEGSRKLTPGTTGGTYEPVVPKAHCLLDAFVAFQVNQPKLGPFSGGVQKHVVEAPCSEVNPATMPVTAVSDGTW